MILQPSSGQKNLPVILHGLVLRKKGQNGGSIFMDDGRTFRAEGPQEGQM